MDWIDNHLYEIEYYETIPENHNFQMIVYKNGEFHMIEYFYPEGKERWIERHYTYCGSGPSGYNSVIDHGLACQEILESLEA